MKKLIIILFATVITSASFAAPVAEGPGHGHGGGGWHGGGFRSRVYIGGGWYNPWYGPWGYYGYYPYYGYSTPPSKLDIQIDAIRVNYADKIKSARMDHELTRDGRKRVIKDLKTQRENEILQAKRDFYKY